MTANKRLIYQGLQAEIDLLTAKEVHENSEDHYGDFNETGWVKTRDALNEMIITLDALEAVKADRKTPQFYRPIHHRALTATADAKKLIDSINNSGVKKPKVDYDTEIPKLREQLAALHAKA